MELENLLRKVAQTAYETNAQTPEFKQQIAKGRSKIEWNQSRTRKKDRESKEKKIKSFLKKCKKKGKTIFCNSSLEEVIQLERYGGGAGVVVVVVWWW